MKRPVLIRILIIVIAIMLAAGAVWWGRGKIKDLASKLKLEKIPLIEKFIKREEVPTVPEEEMIPEEEILVKVYRVAKRSFEDTLPALGTIRGFREIDLKFEIAGLIDSFNFREGERIREDDIIATLNQKDALLKLKYNEIEVDKYRKLYEIGSIAKIRLEQAELEYESAKNDLEKTYLYAPRDGILGSRNAEVGEYVTPNDKMATLIDSLDVFVELGIIETDIGKVRVGEEARVFVDTYPDTEFKGIVDNLSPVVEGRSRTQTAKIRVRNDDGLLLPGMFTRALIAVYATDNAIIVPSVALNKAEEGYVVFIIHETEEETEEAIGYGTAESRPIEFEYRSSDYSVIKRGIKEGELVVVETQEKLKDGSRVAIAEIQEQLF